MQNTPTPEALQVILDGQPVTLPSGRKSLNAIRSYLETLALERQRILCSLNVDGEPAKSSRPEQENFAFSRVEAETLDLTEMPLQMLGKAMQQTAEARSLVTTAVSLVLINDGPISRELWWEMVRRLKEPLLTLSLLPETACPPAQGSASMMQLRKWQLQQLAVVIKDVDEACWQPDVAALSNALENRVMPWLDGLHGLIAMWHQTVLAGARLRCGQDS